MTVKTSISLTDQQNDYARSLVERGEFSSVSAVLQHGLNMLRRDSEQRETELALMRKLIDERRQGPFMTMDELRTDVEAMLERKRRSRAAL